eukprot:jgi/Tetstr1/455002/TSEL_041860.t1
MWSNKPLSEPVQILKSAPTRTPEIRAGRPLFYALYDKKKPDALKVERYLYDFKKVRSYITDLTVQLHFSPIEIKSLKNLLDDLDEMQTSPSAAFSMFWPQRKEEVDIFLREHGQAAPAVARHTVATNADLTSTMPKPFALKREVREVWKARRSADFLDPEAARLLQDFFQCAMTAKAICTGPLANLELPTVEQLPEAIATTTSQRINTPPEVQHAQWLTDTMMAASVEMPQYHTEPELLRVGDDNL